MAPREQVPKEDDADEEPLECSNTCIAISIGIVAILFGWIGHRLSQPVDPLDSRVAEFEGDGVLRTVVYPHQGGAGGRYVPGPNSRAVSYTHLTLPTICSV